VTINYLVATVLELCCCSAVKAPNSVNYVYSY